MASRKDELNKAKEAGKSIVANKFASDASTKTDTKTDVKETPVKKEESLVANQFGAKKEKTWNDVKSEYNNDPAKIADYLNNATDYTAGNLTKKGMEGFGYSQGADGKWAPKPKTETPTTETPTTETETTGTTAETETTGTTAETETTGTTAETETTGTTAETETTGTTAETETTGTTTKTETTTDDALNGVETITKEDPKTKKFVDGVTNKDGSVDEYEAYNAMSQYEQKLVEMGAGSFDKDGKFVFKDTTKKGWEDWATMLSVGASVIGLAMGVPIVPINFRKITNKDEKDAKIREFQKQYTDIMADSARTIDQMNADVAAGQIAQNNQDALAAQEKHAQATAATKDVISAQTDAEKDLIETRTDAEIKKDEEQFERDMQKLKADQNFKLKYAALQQKYTAEMAELQDALTTDSTLTVMKYQNSGFLKDLKDMGITPKELASYAASKNGISPADKNWNRVNTVGNILGNIIEAIK